MNDQLQHLVAGRSKIIQRQDDQGNPILELETSELTPFREKLADNLADLTTFAAVALAIYLLVQAGEPEPAEMIFAFLAVIASHPSGLRFWRGFLRQKTSIIMTLDTIYFHGEKGAKELNRMQKHQFWPRDHDEGSLEKRNFENELRRAQKKNHVPNRKPYYAESYHVVLTHMGQRNDLLEVYEKKNANDVVAALILCDNHLNNFLNIGDEGRQGKEDDWKDSPGGL